MGDASGQKSLALRRQGAAAAGTILVATAAAILLARSALGGRGATWADKGPPSVSDVQAAYDAAALLGGDLHDKDLKIVGVDCRLGTSGRYSCQVGFVKSDTDATRVYLDAALVERNASNEWTLLRGLCRRLL